MVIATGVPAAKDSGPQIESAGADGRVRARLRFRPEMVRPGGTLSGPTMMTLADALTAPDALVVVAGAIRSGTLASVGEEPT